MKEFRLGRNTTAHFSSFAECAKAFGIKSDKKKMKEKTKQKLENDKDIFSKKHVCPACGQTMTHFEGSRVMFCANENCKGIKFERKDKEGNVIVTYKPSYELLRKKRDIDFANAYMH